MKYISCKQIEHGINFDRDSIKLCCQYSAKGGGDTRVIDGYHGEPIDWNAFFAFKKEIKDLHKSGQIYHKCEGCIYLTEQEWEDEYDRFNFFNLDYWTRCNCNCIYCHTHNRKDDYNTRITYNFLPILKEMEEKGMLMDGGDVSFGGGEITLLKEFEECMNIFLNHNYFVRIHSGCIDFSPAVARGLSMGRADVIVSIDAGSREMHERVKEVFTFDRVWNNISEYVKAQSNPELVKVKYIVIPGVNDTTEEIDRFINKCLSVGAGYVLQEIESQWFYTMRGSIPEYVYNLFDYMRKLATSKGLRYGEYERAAHMLAERKENEQK